MIKAVITHSQDEVQVYEFQESGYLFNEKPQPEVLDSESDSESDLTDAELETAVDNEEDSQISHSASFFPFPSKMFARLYFHLHSPRPMVCTALCACCIGIWVYKLGRD